MFKLLNDQEYVNTGLTRDYWSTPNRYKLHGLNSTYTTDYIVNIGFEDLKIHLQNQLDDNDIVYFKSNILSKVRNHFNANGKTLNRTIKRETANAFVFDYSEVKNLLSDIREYYIVPIDEVSQTLQRENIASTAKYLLIDNYYSADMSIAFGPDLKYEKIKLLHIKKKSNFHIELVETLNVFDSKCPNAKLVFDTSIKNVINDHEIDYEKYKDINGLLKTNDPQNINIGFEILGNANPDNNIVAISLLMVHNWPKAKSILSKNRNAKQLSESCFERGIRLGADWRVCLNELFEIKNNSFTTDETKIINEFLRINYNAYLKLGNNNNNKAQIEIKELTI